MGHLLTGDFHVGEVTHKGASYPGQHSGIISRDVFDRVQQLLEKNRHDRRRGTNAREVSPLAGLMTDGHGRRMSPSHAVKQARRYRYYVSQNDGDAARNDPPWRISAADIERRVAARLAQVIDHQRQAAAAGPLQVQDIVRLGENTSAMVDRLRCASGSGLRDIMLELIRRIDVTEALVTRRVDLSPVDPALGAERALNSQAV